MRDAIGKSDIRSTFQFWVQHLLDTRDISAVRVVVLHRGFLWIFLHESFPPEESKYSKWWLVLSKVSTLLCHAPL